MKGGNQETAFQPIDIKKVLQAKNPKAADKVPGFVYRWLTRILHLKEVNGFMKNNGHLSGIDFTDAALKFLDIKFNFIGEENLPKDGRFMFVSNHPLGGLDGVILLNYLNKRFGTTRSLTNDFLMNIAPLSDWFVPINKVGGQARDSIKTIEALYESNDQIMIFPAGLCSRKIKGKIVDLEWQKHFITKAIKHNLTIVPIYFDGHNSKRFYNLAKLRKFFRLKINIEMMFLSDEMFRHKGKTFSIYFGKPMPYEYFNKKKKPAYWANHVKEKVYQLKEN